VFADLDETIRQLLIRYVPLDLAEVDISFDAPDREWSGRLSRPTVNCFMWDVRENLELREYDWDHAQANGVNTRTRIPMRMNASYQVTVWARAPEDEHRLLWRVLSVLARHNPIPEDVCHGALKDQVLAIPTKVAQPEPARANPADLWQALDNRIRPGLGYVVTLPFDPEVSFTAPLVFTRSVRTLRGVTRADAESVAEVTQIAGRVRDRADASRGIKGASVLLRETGLRVTTDASGRFKLRQVPPGAITLQVKAPDREEVSQSFTIPSPNYEVDV
jgi:hypothetical protein